MKTRDNQHPEQRRDTIKSHLVDEHRHDPYKAHGKLPEPTSCPKCGAVFENGRWRWAMSAPAGAQAHICPACHRIADKFPAGELTLEGGFLARHSAEIIGLARNIEEAQKREHPMQRRRY